MTTKTATFKIADFNVNGGYDTDRGTWKHRRPIVIDTILAADPDVLLLQEAHEDRDEHKWIATTLNAQSSRSYKLVAGDGGNHFVIDEKVLRAVVKATTIHLPHDRDYSELNLWHRDSGVRWWTWNTHLIATDADKGRTPEKARALRLDQAKVIAGRVARLHRCVGGGDTNDAVGGLRASLELVGHDDVRTRVATVANGDLNSWDHYTGNPQRGEWIDLIAAGELATVNAAGLIDSGDASDHNLIWASVSITGPATKF